MISLSLETISSYFDKISLSSDIFNFVISIKSSSSFKTAILCLNDATSILLSDRINLLIKSFTLSMGLKANALGIMSKNLSSKLPNLCPNLNLASEFCEISCIFLSFFLNSSVTEGLPSVINVSSSNLHSSLNHLVFKLLSSSGESIFTPRIKYLAVFSS